MNPPHSLGTLGLAVSLLIAGTSTSACSPDARGEMEMTEETGDGSDGASEGSDGSDGSSTDGEPVEYCDFADPALERAVADELGVSLVNAVTVADAAQLMALRSVGEGIASLEGIECAVNLRSIELQDNAVTDLSPLAGLPLEILEMDDNAITGLEPLAGMDTLHTLRVPGNAIESLAPVSGLGLEVLDVARNSLTQLEGLDGHPEMFHLDASSNPLEGVSELAGVSSVRRVMLDDCGLDDETTFPALPEAWELSLADNAFTGLPNTAPFPSLDVLDLSRNAIAELEDGSHNIPEIDLSGNAVSDFSNLGVLSVLRIEHMLNPPQIDTLPLMQSLYAAGSNITSIEGIPTGTYRTLDLSDNDIVDGSPLDAVGAESCAIINLWDNPINVALFSNAQTNLCAQEAQVMIGGDIVCNTDQCFQ